MGREAERLVDARMQFTNPAGEDVAHHDAGGAAGVPLDGHIVGGGLVEFDCGTDTAGDAAHGLDGVGPVDRALAAHPAVVLGQTGQDAGHMVGLFGQTGVKRGELFVGGTHAAGSAGMAGAFGSHR